MNLADLLSYASIDQLTQIAKVYDCQCNGHSKHELIQSILMTVNRKEIVERKLNTMEVEELRFINYLLFESRENFSLEDLIARVNQCRFSNSEYEQQEDQIQSNSDKWKSSTRSKSKSTPIANMKTATPREIILRFKEQGFLFNGYRAENRYLFQVPKDLKENFKISLLEQLKKNIHYCDEPPKYRDEQGIIVQDLKQLLLYVQKHTPAASINGIMYKRNIIQLVECMSIHEEMPSKGAWKFGYGKFFGEYPDRLSLMFDYCWRNSWIGLKQDQLIVTSEGEAAIYEMNDTLIPHLVDHWLKVYRTPIPNLHTLLYWISKLSNDWLSVNSLSQVLLPFIRPYYFDTADCILEKRILNMMLHLGLIRYGNHEQFGLLLKLTISGQKIVRELKY